MSSLNEALKSRQDRENGLIWADNIYNNQIYLGNGYDAKNYQQLCNHHITHIINCANDVPNYYENYIPSGICETTTEEGGTVESTTTTSDGNQMTTPSIESINTFQYYNLDIHDFGQDKGISRVFQSTIDMINEILLNPSNKILIHCANGSNRSATIAIIVLMKLYGSIYLKYFCEIL